MNRITIRDLVVPGMLVVLSLVPMYGGIVRLWSLSAGATVDNARFVATPTPVVLHVVGATLYAMLGAFQFSGDIRRRWPGWHRGAGMVLTLCGLLTGLTGMWMAAVYRIPEGLQGPVLLGVRMLVGTAIEVAIVLAWLAIRRRDVSTHEAWMLHAYALAQGAGTQALVAGRAGRPYKCHSCIAAPQTSVKAK
jgi:hypothetical protein